MKIIKYKLLMGEVTTASGEIQRNLVDAEILCPTEKDYENNLPIVQKTACNGEYTIEDDGVSPYPIAPHNILEGDYVTIGGVLYKAIANIPNGEPVIAGQNAIETTIEAQLRELKGE